MVSPFISVKERLSRPANRCPGGRAKARDSRPQGRAKREGRKAPSGFFPPLLSSSIAKGRSGCKPDRPAGGPACAAAPLPKGGFLNILELLSCESSELFLRYFKDSLNELVQNQFVAPDGKGGGAVPQDFLVNHISGSFVEMVLWWIKGGMKQTPEELDRYFRAVIEPIL